MRFSSYIGKAEGIHSQEVSARASVEKLEYSLERLEGQRGSLESTLSTLNAEYIAAELDTDDEGYPDYTRMHMISARINAVQMKIDEVDHEIGITRGDLNISRQELREAEEAKRATLREIQEHASLSSRNLSLAGGMIGAYASIGGKLQGTIQSGLNDLLQAASILGGSIHTGGGGGSGSSSRKGHASPSAKGGTSLSGRSPGALNAILADKGNPTAPRTAFTTGRGGRTSPAMSFGKSVKSAAASSALKSGSAYASSRKKASAPSGTNRTSGAAGSGAQLLSRGAYESRKTSSGMQSRLGGKKTGRAKRASLPSPSGMFFDAYTASITADNAVNYTAATPISIGKRLYTPKIFSAQVNVTDPQTKKRSTVKSSRKVFQMGDNSINLDLVIPAGICVDGVCLKHPITNRKLMAKGRAPFVIGTDGVLSRLNLHHVTSQETYNSGQWGDGLDGTLMELPCRIHKLYSNIIHINRNMKDTSFRSMIIKTENDERVRVKTFDCAKFNAIRIQYWKERLRQLEAAASENTAAVTAIDSKVTQVIQENLPQSIKSTFMDSQYRTVVATEDMTLFRVYGGHSGKQGIYLTTERPVDRIGSKYQSALLHEWKNTREYYCEVHIPKGTVLNIGKAAPQRTISGAILSGGGDQVVVSSEFARHPSNYGKEYPLGFS